jgi:hypothetical protein
VLKHGDNAQPVRYQSGVKIFALAFLGVLAAAACGGDGAAATPPPPVAFSMLAQNGTTVAGTGSVVTSADSFSLTIKLTGLAPNSSHVSHIHAGACSAPGGIAFALQQVIADSAGAATITTAVPSGYLVPTSGWYVNVHHGPDFSAPANAPSDSCGDLPAA